MKQQSSPSAVYYVKATSIPNRFYAVGEFPGARQVFRCECKAGQNGRRCWHVEVVVAGAVRPARLKGAAPATPAVTAEAVALERLDALFERNARRAVLESLYA